ncbi:uncharacterized protein [Watersipora subatra]|uniref:uncharacterized protein isoform X2 n=1 Tax=Watersipora subatra TaxID=2589382 RepID=UPI00355C3BDB
MLTSIPPDKVSDLLSIKNSVSRTPLKDAESEGRKETVELLKSWKQPLLAVPVTATFWKFAALQDADNQRATALAQAERRIGRLQDQAEQHTAALAQVERRIGLLQDEAEQHAAALANQREESQQQVVALQEANNQMTAALANQREESQQQVVALQEANNQMLADTAAMMERLNRLDIYLRTPTDTDETGDQLHEPLG